METVCGCSCAGAPMTQKPTIRVIDQHHRLGANVELKETLFKTASQYGTGACHCIQFYLGSPQTYTVRSLKKDDIDKTREYCDRYGKTLYVHCPLIANLSKDSKNQEEVYQKDLNILKNSWRAVKSEIKQMNSLPASCVLHMGSKGSLEKLVENLNDLNVPRNSHINQNKLLCLENAAAQKNSLGKDFEEVRKVFEGLDNNTIGLCIDTQHIYGAGVNSLSNHNDIVKLFDDCQDTYGKKPDVIHLNDSKKVFNGKVDRHECITQGYIWSAEENKEGLVSLLDICYDQSIDLILETPDSSLDLRLIRSKYMDLQTIDTYKI